jgi:hypothetical protein
MLWALDVSDLGGTSTLVNRMGTNLTNAQSFPLVPGDPGRKQHAPFMLCREPWRQDT